MTSGDERPRPRPRPGPGRPVAPAGSIAPASPPPAPATPSAPPTPPASPAPGRRPLLVPAHRRGWAVTVLVAAAVFAAIAAWVHGTDRANGVDNWVAARLFLNTGPNSQRLMLHVSEPVVTLGVAALVFAVAVYRRHWTLAALAAAAPVVSVGLSKYVLKPAVDRVFGEVYRLSDAFTKRGLAYPSGHETALAVSATMLGVVLLRSGAGPREKRVGVGVLVLWVVIGSFGLVRSSYHFFTDTVGGVCLALVLVPLLAALLDVAAAAVARLRADRVS